MLSVLLSIVGMTVALKAFVSTGSAWRYLKSSRRCLRDISLGQFDTLEPGDLIICRLPRKPGEYLAEVVELDWPHARVKASGLDYRVSWEAVKRFAPPQLVSSR